MKNLLKCFLLLFYTSTFILAQQNKDPYKLSAINNIDSSGNVDQVFYFYEPFPMKVGSYILQLGGSVTLLPVAVMENEYPSPALDMQYKLGKWENVSLIASLSTNIFSNLLHAGIQWNTKADRFSFGIANHLGGFYGFFNTEGQFDENSAYALYYLPIIRAGYRFDDFSASISLAISYIFKSTSKVSGLKAAGPQNTVNDIFCTIAVEQPFLKQSYISMGFSLTYAVTPYQSWMMYNTIDNHLFIPEFFLAFQL